MDAYIAHMKKTMLDKIAETTDERLIEYLYTVAMEAFIAAEIQQQPI